jgi:hypothetical protein
MSHTLFIGPAAGAVLAVRPVPSTADWWMVGLTLAAAVGTVGALFAVLAANRHARNATTKQLTVQREELELTRLALDDERRARQEEIARIDAERQDAEARQARRVSTQPFRTGSGEIGRGVREVVFTVHDDSAGPIHNVGGELYRCHPAGNPTRILGAHAVPLERVAPGGFGQLVFVPTGGPYLEGWDSTCGVNGPEFLADIVFTDEAGLRWRRRGTAQPTRVLLDPAQDHQ